MPDPIAHDLTFLFTDVEGSTLLLDRLGPGTASCSSVTAR